MLSRTAASGANACVSSSWNEEHSHTTVASPPTWSTSEHAAVPTLPATATGRPASRWMCPISSTVVVLPFVPVTAMNSFASNRHPSSSSPSTGRARSCAAAITGALARTPGLLTTARTRSSSETPSSPSRSSTPASTSTPVPSGAPASTPITSSPLARSASAAAIPERARPTTRYGPLGICGRGFNSTDALPVDREADRAADRGNDPETQDDLRLRPGAQLEMVVDRRHQEHPFAGGLEGDHLNHHRQRLDHEDPPEQDQQQLVLVHHRQPRHRPAQPQRARIAHEDRRRKRVEPEKADRAAHQAAGEHRQFELTRDEGYGDVREQHDRRAARGQAIETVGEVDRARRTRHDQVG